MNNFRLDSVLVGSGIANMKLKMGDEIRIFSLAEIEGVAEKILPLKVT